MLLLLLFPDIDIWSYFCQLGVWISVCCYLNLSDCRQLNGASRSVLGQLYIYVQMGYGIFTQLEPSIASEPRSRPVELEDSHSVSLGVWGGLCRTSSQVARIGGLDHSSLESLLGEEG